MTGIYILALTILSMLAGGGYMYVKYAAPRRKPEPGHEFVFVEKDGTVRELNADEELWLERNFYPGDPKMPFLKRNFEEKNPDGNLAGFIPRRKVPPQVEVLKKDHRYFNPN